MEDDKDLLKDPEDLELELLGPLETSDLDVLGPEAALEEEE